MAASNRRISLKDRPGTACRAERDPLDRPTATPVSRAAGRDGITRSRDLWGFRIAPFSMTYDVFPISPLQVMRTSRTGRSPLTRVRQVGGGFLASSAAYSLTKNATGSIQFPQRIVLPREPCPPMTT